MKKELEQIIGQAAGTFGIAIKHLQTGEEVVINGKTFFPMASVFKIPILAALFAETDAQRMSLTDRVELETLDRVPGSGVLKELAPGVQMSVKDLATLMIIISDNMATDKLLQLIGIEKVQSYVEKLGLQDLYICQSCWDMLAQCVNCDPSVKTVASYQQISDLLNMKKMDMEKTVAKGSNVATVVAMNQLIEKIARNQVISGQACEEMIGILLKQQLNQRLPHLLPHTVKVAHKTGTIGNAINDAGIIFLPENKGTVIISVFSIGNQSMDEGAETIAKISKAAFDYFVQ
ncbi:serine hydrolase [Bacillaceae bacterium Marseille-Q3522]|nr:serine hydrolase [Bacillaceae bacterium Marseille-Q3522]